MTDRWEEKIFRMAEQEQIVMPRKMSDRIENVLCKLEHMGQYTGEYAEGDIEDQYVQERKGRRHAPKEGKAVRFRMNWKKSIVLAAALVMLVSATAAASVGALRERMEAMNREKIEQYFAQIYANRVGHDNYNRPYLATEKERMKELRGSYESQTLFPDGELTMIDRAEDYKGRGVAFLGNTATFFFPEKEMSDEELLQIIDFMYKRDYSLQKMNEMIQEGEARMPDFEEEIQATEEEILNTDAVYEPAQALTIPYTGELELDLTIAAGRNEIFLAGFNAVHRMKTGSSESELFFDDFGAETRILAMCQDKNGDLYLAFWQWADGNDPESNRLALWVVDAQGELLRKIDMAQYLSPEKQGYTRRMALDDDYLYLSVAGLENQKKNQECEILVLDREGNYVSRIAPDEYELNSLGGLGLGRDGRVYTQIEKFYDPDEPDRGMGIASLDGEKGELGDIYFDIMPEGTIMIDIIAPGAESDFVFWGYDGIFAYDPGDEKAEMILPAYEAPCSWEGARYCALPDGRILFASASEYRSEETPLGKRFYAVPEKTCFYYVPGVRAE